MLQAPKTQEAARHLNVKNNTTVMMEQTSMQTCLAEGLSSKESSSTNLVLFVALPYPLLLLASQSNLA